MFVFCGPIRQITPPRDFPGAVLYGVRTFLEPTLESADPRPSNRPEMRSSYLCTGLESIVVNKWVGDALSLPAKLTLPSL